MRRDVRHGDAPAACGKLKKEQEKGFAIPARALISPNLPGRKAKQVRMKPGTQLQRNVLDELQYEPSVDPAQIGVTARGGIVTLSGTVKTYAEKCAAVRAAERVSGVRAVADEIQVDLPFVFRRTDEDIAQAALDALRWDVIVPDQRIQVKVSNGWVTLEGTVDHKYEQAAAEAAVRNLTGIQGVLNRVAIKPTATPFEVKAQIQNAFRRSAELEARKINVDVHGDKVILSGNVHSWAERDRAERAAWSAPGVSAVEDDLTVVV